MKKKVDVVNILAIFITLAGLLVLLGWIFDITLFKSIIKDAITMKIVTAQCFVLSGLSLYFLNKHEREKSKIVCVVLPFLTFILFAVMLSYLISDITGSDSFIQDAFYLDDENPSNTQFPGRPAIITIISFILISIANMISFFHVANVKKKFFAIGLVMMVSVSIAIIGYILNIPVLYYEINNFSNGIAINTMALFIIYSIGLLKLSSLSNS